MLLSLFAALARALDLSQVLRSAHSEEILRSALKPPQQESKIQESAKITVRQETEPIKAKRTPFLCLFWLWLSRHCLRDMRELPSIARESSARSARPDV